jgi:hypothetical protein
MQSGKLDVRALDGLKIEGSIFDMDHHVLDVACSLDVEGFHVRHGHSRAIVLDAAHFHSLDPLRLVVAQTITLSDPAIVHAELETALEINRPFLDFRDGLA